MTFLFTSEYFLSVFQSSREMMHSSLLYLVYCQQKSSNPSVTKVDCYIEPDVNVISWAYQFALRCWSIHFFRETVPEFSKETTFLLPLSLCWYLCTLPAILGSLRGVTQSWQRWFTCCSTTFLPCRPTQPRTCSTCAMAIIGLRQR